MSPHRIPLRLVLMLPVLLQVGAAVGLTAWFSLRNGEQAVNNVASQLRSSVNQQIQDHLLTYVAVPHQVNQINADAIRLGHLTLLSDRDRERYFAQRLVTFPVITHNFWAHIQNDTLVESLGARRLVGTMEIIRRDPQTGENRYYATDAKGYATNVVQIAPGFDPRQRPWYKAAIAHQGPTWSGIYHDFSTGGLSMTAALPVYSDDGRFLGVVGATLSCGEPIDAILQQHPIGQRGLTFVVDNQGELVGTSSNSRIFVTTGENLQRIAATASENPLIRQTATFLTEQLADWSQIDQTQQLSFTVAGEPHYLQITPLNDDRGLDWQIVTVVPRSEFMAPIQANSRRTIQLCGLALVIATGWGLLTTHWIRRTVLQVSQAVDALSQGNLDQRVPPASIAELNTLATAFNRMATQIQTTFNQLDNQLEDWVAEPTQALQATQEEADAAEPGQAQILGQPEP